MASLLPIFCSVTCAKRCAPSLCAETGGLNPKDALLFGDWCVLFCERDRRSDTNDCRTRDFTVRDKRGGDRGKVCLSDIRYIVPVHAQVGGKMTGCAAVVLSCFAVEARFGNCNYK